MQLQWRAVPFGIVYEGIRRFPEALHVRLLFFYEERIEIEISFTEFILLKLLSDQKFIPPE